MEYTEIKYLIHYTQHSIISHLTFIHFIQTDINYAYSHSVAEILSRHIK